MHFSRRLQTSAIALAATIASFGALAPAAGAVGSSRISDPFFHYTDTKPLDQIAPGTVLKTRTVQFHLFQVPMPVEATQLLYRSRNVNGKPTVNVTSVIRPGIFNLATPNPSKVIAYGSFYDSLDPRDQPSLAIAGQSNSTLGGALSNVESLAFTLNLLGKGYTVVVTDTEGQEADFAAGPVYGYNTLDGLRAALNSPQAGVPSNAKIGLMGYSGGAIATEWAAELAPTYAPEINSRLVGAAMGGVLVNPFRNLTYVDGSQIWAGVMGMALIGISRAFEVDLLPYASDYGKDLFSRFQHASITDALLQFPGLRFSDLTKPGYQRPKDFGLLVRTANRLIMGTGGTPTVPLLMYQGAGGEAEGTYGGRPDVGAGDGVMVAGDVRTLARQYCEKGVPVIHKEFPDLSHVGSAGQWMPDADAWLTERFAGKPAPQNCADIKPGNSLAPVADPDAPPAPEPPVPPVPVPDNSTGNNSGQSSGGSSSGSNPAPTVTTPTSAPSKTRAVISLIRVRGRTVQIKVRCEGTIGRCRMTATGSAGGSTVLRKLTISLSAGSTRTFTARLSSRGRRTLSKRSSMAIRVSTVQGTTRSSKSVKMSRPES